ncbi:MULTISPECIES: hypothetical protein [Bradyrhizobium]|nr:MULTISPECIES: hypothetical protein [Bradyrhizobium]MCG2629307.1 hypothetical protein [Bradyrhizobium zhengyangense]MCG2644588.1 hypothetical protein [Bradyrhizobium zhengyangense]MCG2670821.1 hypothetical protein [Bradyrhizobium zhengyangense]MDN4984453.1 hypothetical protein [Bradyrhizobium sp. WYCCWR 13022]MDN5002445.1 hypothetical protein [Bradyrhizobium sp. WYCCWR 12677]
MRQSRAAGDKLFVDCAGDRGGDRGIRRRTAHRADIAKAINLLLNRWAAFTRFPHQQRC